jgi:hypothetical protein
MVVAAKSEEKNRRSQQAHEKWDVGFLRFFLPAKAHQHPWGTPARLTRLPGTQILAGAPSRLFYPARIPGTPFNNNPRRIE